MNVCDNIFIVVILQQKKKRSVITSNKFYTGSFPSRLYKICVAAQSSSSSVNSRPCEVDKFGNNESGGYWLDFIEKKEI